MCVMNVLNSHLFCAGKGRAQAPRSRELELKLSSSGKPSSRACRADSEQGTASAPPPKKKIKRHQTAAHLCQYSTTDSEVTVGQAVSVRKVVDVIAEMSWS